MPSDAFRVSTLVSAQPERVYSAWLDSGAHSAFTGGEAKIDATIGGKFSAWDGYIHGRTVELLAGRRIVQVWRTKEFPSGSADSRLEVQFEPAEGGTRITILHSNIPLGQGERYKSGWNDKYFAPMRDYFARLLSGPAMPKKRPAPPAAKAPAAPVQKKGEAKVAATHAASAKKVPPQKAAPKSVPAPKAAPAKAGGKKVVHKSRPPAAAKRPASSKAGKGSKGRKR